MDGSPILCAQPRETKTARQKRKRAARAAAMQTKPGPQFARPQWDSFCNCDRCRYAQAWPGHYVGSLGLSFECFLEGRAVGDWDRERQYRVWDVARGFDGRLYRCVRPCAGILPMLDCAEWEWMGIVREVAHTPRSRAPMRLDEQWAQEEGLSLVMRQPRAKSAPIILRGSCERCEGLKPAADRFCMACWMQVKREAQKAA
jgi:hypothetical protein